MKQFVIFVFVLIMLIAGCGEPRKSGVDVSVVGADKFPAELAGVWRASDQGWEITLSPNGEIVEIVHTIGRVRLLPGETREVEMLMDGISIYEPGQWLVIYDADLQELTVEIVLDYFYAEIGTGVVEGSSTDIFTGKVEDGKVWLADWVAAPEYFATTEEQGRVQLTDKDEPQIRSIVFDKVTP